MIVAWDTETTGIPLWKEPSELPGQPHLCSIAWIECDDNAVPLEGEHRRRYLLVRPDAYYSEMPDDALGIHKLTIERLQDEGVSLEEAVEEFFCSVEQSLYDVAFNRYFDFRILRIAQHRLRHDEAQLDWWKGRPSNCALKGMTKLLKLPATPEMKKYPGLAWRNKTPDLNEVHTFLFGEPHEGAHGAAEDAEAMRRIWHHQLGQLVMSL